LLCALVKIVLLTRLVPALRKLTLVAVAAFLAFVPLPAAYVENETGSVGYTSSAGQEVADHKHSHDDGDPIDHSADYKHGHDPADHSHQFVFLTGGSSQWGLPPAQRWPSALSGRPDASIGFGIERPPKQSTSL
jgi:hypothetical protein